MSLTKRRIIESPGAQLNLGELVDPGQGQAPQQKRVVSAHTRSVAPKTSEAGEQCVPFFDETRVPVETIELPAQQAAGLAPDQFEVISYKDSYRLAQRPGSYVVLKYRRPVIKLRETQSIVCTSAPTGVIEGSRAEVSFVAGVLIDKFAYHIPLYRQHQRLGDCGITVSRAWLSQLMSVPIARNRTRPTRSGLVIAPGRKNRYTELMALRRVEISPGPRPPYQALAAMAG